ncbi:Mad3/BUB1 homology region 1-domain-containing protein [Tuber brumale]|nr:Mad3/BUB1 homology region 1-domain-containing protein [Tuber brumale]
MMADDDTTSFDQIELHKENIQPLASGRSARALVASLSSRSNPVFARAEHAAKQAEFEEELRASLDLDDPLEVWVRYVNWTQETFPSGHSTDSGLLQLLERATQTFIHEQHYKNDPRYLRLWIQYIQSFSDAPREAFAYLARHDIGQRLALFYEEYAALLEKMGRKRQAGEIYQTGMENNARPTDRLLRKFEEYMQRLEHDPPADDEPSSPALPAVRPALAAKPFGGGLGSGGLGGSPTTQQQPQAPQPKLKQAKQKMAIFSDADATTTSKAPNTIEKPTSGWENIGTLEQRKKENTIEARPWAGEVLKQEGVKTKSAEKMMIFRDESSLPKQSIPPVQQNVLPTFLPSNKRPERVAVNLELIYADEENPTEELSFDELRAIKRGQYGIDWNRIREEQAEAARERRRKNTHRGEVTEESRAPIKVKTVLSPSPNRGKIKRKGQAPASPTMTFHTRAATDEIYDIFNQPMKKTSMTGENRGDDDGSESGGEESDSEDYTIGTQVGQAEGSGPEGDDGEDDEEDARSVKSEWSDFTLRRDVPPHGEEEEEVEGSLGVHSAEAELGKLAIHRDEPKAGGRMAIHRDEPGDEEPGQPLRPTPHKMLIPPPPDDFDPPRLSYNAAKETQFQGQNRLPYMTPIVEKTESLPPTTARRKDVAKTPSRNRMPDIMDDNLMSSPFEESNNSILPPPLAPPQPAPSAAPARVPKERKPFGAKPAPAAKAKEATQKGPIIQDLQCNPMDESLRANIFDKLQPPLKTYEGFYEHTTKFGRGAEIKRFAKTMSKRDGEKTTANISQAPIIEFVTGDGGSSYTIKRELGKGAFAPVYLVENNIVADAEDEAEETGPDDGTAADLLSLNKKIIGRARFEAMKMEHPPSPWEFYIMQQAHRRLGVSRPVESILKAYEMHLFPDEGYLLLEYRDQGTILDLVNVARAETATGTNTGVMDEQLAMFLSIELLRTVEAMHSKGILHGDLKADNCLIRFENTPDNIWSARYQRDGSNGWLKKGITLIDFGRGIDMKLFPPAVQFIADWKTDNQDCAEMRELRPWTYQVDYFGLAAIIHSMLFGKYIETAADRGNILGGGTKKYKITGSFKRYWQTEIWSSVFDVLLNPLQYVKDEENTCMPVSKSVRKCREGMETWLEANCEKGVGLKNLIRRMEGVFGKKR